MCIRDSQYVGENPISRTDRLGLQFENEKDIETTPFQSLQDELNELGLPYINPLTGESEVNILENKYAAENLENISEVLDVFNTYQEYLQNQSQHSVQSNAVCTAQNPQATPSPNNEVLRAPYIVKLSP